MFRSRSSTSEQAPAGPSTRAPSVASGVVRPDRTVCGNPACGLHWLSFLKDRRRPVFEGSWACSAACLRAMVEAAVRREAREAGAAGSDAAPRHRVPLGLILLEQGRITHPQLQKALSAQSRAGSGRIGEWLAVEHGVAPEHVTRALALQWGCPVLTSEGFQPHRMALTLPRVLLETSGAVPLRVAAGRFLYLGFDGEPDTAAAFAIERMNGLKVQLGLIAGPECHTARRSLKASPFVETRYQPVSNKAALSRAISSAVVAAQPMASRLVRLRHFYWLRMWLETGAMSARDGGLPSSPEDVADCVYTVGAQQ